MAIFTLVCYTAVFRVVTQRSSPQEERCVTSLKTAVQTIFTLETNYPSETGYPSGDSRQTDNTSKFEIWSGPYFGWTIRLVLSICFSVNFDGF